MSSNIRPCAENKNGNYTFYRIMPFVIINVWKSGLFYNFKSVPRYFHMTWHKYKASSNDVQRTRTLTLLAFIKKLCLFVFVSMEILSALKWFKIFLYNVCLAAIPMTS